MYWKRLKNNYYLKFFMSKIPKSKFLKLLYNLKFLKNNNFKWIFYHFFRLKNFNLVLSSILYHNNSKLIESLEKF